MPISYSEQVSLDCPACGKNFEATAWMIIDADERPDLIDALRVAELNVAQCPACGNRGKIAAPLMYHNAQLQRVLFAGDPSVPEHELRQQAQALLNLMMDAIPEELHRPYHEDVYVTEGLEGVQRVIERDDRRLAARNRATGGGSPASPNGEKKTLETALKRSASAESQSPMLQAAQALVRANGPEELDEVLSTYPFLLRPASDEELNSLIQEAQQAGQADTMRTLLRARMLMVQLRLRPGAEPQTPEAVAVPEPELDRQPYALEEPRALEASSQQAKVFSEAAFLALLQATSEAELLRATIDYPVLLEGWVDEELAQRAEAALDIGHEQYAQQIEDRREALVSLRMGAKPHNQLAEAVRTLLAADDEDDIALLLDSHPILLSDAAGDMLQVLAAEAQGRGDSRMASVALHYRALLHEIRQGLEYESL
jgi:hypothetical protein